MVGSTHEQAVSTSATINEKAAQIADLNAQIALSEGAGGEASDLRDRRDTLTGDLARLAGVTTFETGSGQATVLVAGHVLVQGEHAATVRATRETDGSTTIAVGSAAASQMTVQFGDDQGGKLGALIAVQKDVLGELMPRLDQLAHDLAVEINARHRTGFDLDGAPGGDLFTPPGAVAGAAATLEALPGLEPRQIAASSTAAGVPGNNENALALADLAHQPLAGAGASTFSEEAAALAGRVGAMTEGAIRTAAVRKDELSYITSLQQSHDGVSLDEEMIQLVQYQRTYQAGVRVLQVVDELLERMLAI